MVACLALPSVAAAGAPGAPEAPIDAILRIRAVDVEQDSGAGTPACRDRGTALVSVTGGTQGAGLIHVVSECGDTGGVYRAHLMGDDAWSLDRLGAQQGTSYAYIGMGMTMQPFYLYARDVDPVTGVERRYWVGGDPVDLAGLLE